MFRKIAAVALLAVAALAGTLSFGPRAEAGVSRSAVHGQVHATSAAGSEQGRFRLIVGSRSNGATFDRIEAFAHHLTVGSSAATTPSYHVVLVSSDGSLTGDFGAMRVNANGNAAFLFDTRVASLSLPSGVTDLTDFSGGTVEIRDSNGAVASGTIPTFVGVNGSSGSGAAAFGHDRQPLHHVAASFAGRGEILARRQNLPAGVREEFRVNCGRMVASTTYTVVAIDSSSNETTLGSFTTGSPLGAGGFRVATAHGGTIPGGNGLAGLYGQTVEVRDGSGTAVLTGTFPTIQ